MLRKKSFWIFLIFTIVSGILLGYLIKTFSPYTDFIIYNQQISTIIIFFFLCFFFLFNFVTLLLRNKIQGLLITLLVITYLLLRLYEFTQLFYVLLLLTTFGALELAFLNFKKEKGSTRSKPEKPLDIR